MSRDVEDEWGEIVLEKEVSFLNKHFHGLLFGQMKMGGKGAKVGTVSSNE